MQTKGTMSEATIIDEADLRSIRFTAKDGVFLFNGAQAAYLNDHADASFAQATLFSCSLHAYAELLKSGHHDAVSHTGFIADEEVRAVRRAAEPHDRVWLAEMGCRLQIAGVDFAEIDSLCQYYFFRSAGYLALLCRRMIEARPEIERFYVLRGPEPLPLDFDFDGDIGYAMVRYFCGLGSRPVSEIVSSRHVLAHGENFLRRPYSTGWATPYAVGESAPDQPSRKIGFLPSAVPTALRIIRDAQVLNCAVTLFYSPWAVSAPRALSDEQEESLITDDDRAWWEAASRQLAGLRAVMLQRLDRSTLPPAIIHNPYLAFQFDYILLKRWLVIAKILRGAMLYVDANPLDLFINSEVVTWEGMILAALYRQKGTKILVAPHSGWPCASFDSSLRPGDRAMVYSALGAESLKKTSDPATVYRIGQPWLSPARSENPEEKLARCRAAIGGKKLVVFVTNPTEISFIPSHDQPAHFAMVTTLGRVPAHLKDKVTLALRRRAPRGGEDNVIYQTFSDLTDQQLDLLNGLTFPECLELADCLVGITQQTSGYYEIFQSRKPVLHLQGISTFHQQPDLPAELLGNLSDPEALWPAIERALFDDAYREDLVGRQSRFVDEDLSSDFPLTQSPVRTLLHMLLSEDQ